MRKPNLFLVGAPKAGSSLLWTMLKEHKDIFFSTNPEKEINHFSYDELEQNSYYKDYKVKSAEDYLKVFKKGQSVKYLVDGSVSYFAYPSIPKKLYEFNPEAKIIVIVRDPISRAFSHYNMDKRMGYAKEPFHEYLINKEEKYKQYFHQYIENSLYYKNVQNYLKYFDESQIFILQLEKINDDVNRLCVFLGIEKLKLKLNHERVNENKIPTNIISRTLQHNRHLATTLKRIIPTVFVRYFNFLLYKKAENIELQEFEKLLLEEHLKEDYLKFNKRHIQ